MKRDALRKLVQGRGECRMDSRVLGVGARWSARDCRLVQTGRTKASSTQVFPQMPISTVVLWAAAASVRRGLWEVAQSGTQIPGPAPWRCGNRCQGASDSR